MAVIDAAVRFRAKYDNATTMTIGPPVELFTAVDEYVKHELAEPSTTRTNLLSPETAHEAEGWAKQFALTDAGRVFREIYYTWRRAVGRDPMWDDEGLTTDEIEETLNRTHQSISPRVNALKNSGWIIANGEQRKTRSGGWAQVYTPTLAARTYVREHGMPIPIESPRTEERE